MTGNGVIDQVKNRELCPRIRELFLFPVKNRASEGQLFKKSRLH